MLWPTGQVGRVSLLELFGKSKEIQDLVLAPHERISIMRLLLCIIHRAINGPEDEDDREDCIDQIIPASLDYLKQWEHAFNLVSDTGQGAFLQLPGLEAVNEDSATDVFKLRMSAASGNNSTLFDNAGGSDRTVCLEQLAVDLITFQNFAPGGTIGVLKWNGHQTAPKSPASATAAPCIASSAIHLFLKGCNLFETLSLNLIPTDKICPALKGEMGRPVWEQMPQSMEDKDAIRNATSTYLGRLVPVSRAVKIQPNLKSCLLAQGLQYVVTSGAGAVCWEGTMTICRTEKKKGEVQLKVMGAAITRDLWRNLSAILLERMNDNDKPALFNNNNLPQVFNLWLGALVADKAKLLGTMEENFIQLPRTVMQTAVLNKMQKMLDVAERGRNALAFAMGSYLMAMEIKDSGERAKASSLFWSHMLCMKGEYVSLAMRSVGGDEAALRSWMSHICSSARSAFNAIVPHHTTRQLQAWVTASQKLPNVKSLQTHEK